MTAADMGWLGIDLDDRGFVRIELAPREVRSELKQDIAIEDGAITCGATDHPGHPYVVRIVVFDEVLAARGMGHWRVESCCRGDHLIMRIGAAGARIDGDRIALVQNGRDLVEVRVARPNERARYVNGIRRFLN